MNRIYIFKNHQNNIRGYDKKSYQLVVVPVGNEKITENMVFCPAYPVLNHHQKLSDSCCLRSLASAFHSICDNRAVTDLANYIEE